MPKQDNRYEGKYAVLNLTYGGECCVHSVFLFGKVYAEKCEGVPELSEGDEDRVNRAFH